MLPHSNHNRTKLCWGNGRKTSVLNKLRRQQTMSPVHTSTSTSTIPPLAFLHPPTLYTTPVSRQSSKMPGAWINGVLWPRGTTKTLLLQLMILLLSSSSSSCNRTSSSFSCCSSSSSFSPSCHLPYTTAKCTIKRSQTAQCGENTREESARRKRQRASDREREGKRRRGRRNGRRREGAIFGGRK